MDTEQNSKDSQSPKNINFTNRNAVEKFLETEKFRPCANLRCAPVKLQNQQLFMPMCDEGRFDRQGVAEFFEMPSTQVRRLSPVTYMSIPSWAPFISCPSDCKGYRNRTVAKLARAGSSVMHWLFQKPRANEPQTPNKRWWERPVGLLVLGILMAVAADMIHDLIHDKHSVTSAPASQPEQKQNLLPTTQPTDDGPSPKPIAPARPPKKIASGVVTNPVTEPKTPPSQSCPNGICIGGDNNGSAKVENYNGIYPPPNITPTISICAKPSIQEGAIYKTTFVFKTDTEISNPAWWFLFDGPVIDVDVSAPSVIGFAHSHPPCDKIPMCDKSLGITLSNIGGLGSQLPWGPTIPFTAVFTSKQPIRLLEEYGRSMDRPLNENFVAKCE